MNRRTSKITVRHTLTALMLAVVTLASVGLASAEETTIRIAPNTLNLRSAGTVVTVHTEVAYSLVDVYSVYLGGVAINSWKADDRGNFVAKFIMDEIKAIDGLVLNDFNTFQFVGMTTDGEPIWGETEIMIVDRGTSVEDGETGRAAR